jgi:Domain of unknown function (DUF4383)
VRENRIVQDRSPAQLYTLVVGAGLVALGIAGFFYIASFASGDGLERDAVIGILDANGWANVLHVVTGAVALFFVGSYGGARVCAIGLGIVYLVVGVAGFVAGDGGEIVKLVPVGTEDNVLHLLLGIAGIGAGLATPVAVPA